MPKPRVFKTPAGWTWALPTTLGRTYDHWWIAVAVATAVAEVTR